MSKPVIAAISGSWMAGGFEFALSCDLRIAEDGDYLIGLPEANLGLRLGPEQMARLPHDGTWPMQRMVRWVIDESADVV